MPTAESEDFPREPVYEILEDMHLIRGSTGFPVVFCLLNSKVIGHICKTDG